MNELLTYAGFFVWVIVMLFIVNYVRFLYTGPISKRPIRILRIVRKNGSSSFRIQQRDWFGMWRSCTQLIGWDMYAYIEFDDAVEADEYVNNVIQKRIESDGLKVVEKTELNRYK